MLGKNLELGPDPIAALKIGEEGARTSLLRKGVDVLKLMLDPNGVRKHQQNWEDICRCRSARMMSR